MNKYKILDYKHIPGGCCPAIAWSNVLKFNGINLDESMIFGLGSGIYFGYLAIAETKTFNICPTAPNFINNLFSNIGLEGKEYQVSSNKKSLDIIINSIDNGYPVAIQLNPQYCEGVVNATSSNVIKYLPSHWVVISGYSFEENCLFMYDNRKFNLMKIDIDHFVEGRNSGSLDMDQNPRNTHINVLYNAQCFPLEYSIRLSLRKTLLNYFDINSMLSFYIGQYGYEKIIRQFSFLNKLLSYEQTIEMLGRMKMSITGASGIKGAYRLLFASYLDHVSEIFNNKEYQLVADYFRDSYSMWNLLLIKFDEALIDATNIKYWGEDSGFSSIIKLRW